jgi:hypothetical protein
MCLKMKKKKYEREWTLNQNKEFEKKEETERGESLKAYTFRQQIDRKKEKKVGLI